MALSFAAKAQSARYIKSNAMSKDPCDDHIFYPVWQFFKKDYIKTLAWFVTKNPMLGNVSPAQLVLMGREHILRQFIRDSLAANKLPLTIEEHEQETRRDN